MPGGPHLSVRTSAVALALLAGGLLTGCGDHGPPTIAAVHVSDAQRTACRELVSALPHRVAEQTARSVEPAGALGAAWGDPAIVLSCGVSIPSELTRTSACQLADGVGWFVPPDQVDDQDADVVMTAVGYRPIVQVRLPASYRPSGLAAAMVELAPAVKRHTRLVQPCH